MARTQLGRELTEAHRIAQAEQAAWWVSAVSQLVELIDPARIDDSMPEFVASALVALGMAAEDAQSLALAYVREFREAEAPGLDHPAPIVPEVDLSGAASRLESVAPLAKMKISEGAMAREAVDAAFWSIVGGLYKSALMPGREVVDLSASVNPHSTGWRRVTDADPCAFCAMLATRGPAYRTEASALTVSGAHLGGTDYRAVRRGGDLGSIRSRRIYTSGLKRPLGARYHDHCSCTVEEVFGEWEPTPQEQAYVDLYEAVHEPGMTPDEVVAAMRESGHGVVNDAHEPHPKKPGPKPKTKVGGAGGGKPPTRRGGLRGAGDNEPLRPRDVRRPRERTPADWDYWQARQGALGIPTNGQAMKPHEIEFVERMQDLGEFIEEWLPVGAATPRGLAPSNDFFWRDAEFELKRTGAKYQSIKNSVSKAVSTARVHSFTKDRFVVDLGGEVARPKLLAQLAEYNSRNPAGQLQELWVMDARGLRRVI